MVFDCHEKNATLEASEEYGFTLSVQKMLIMQNFSMGVIGLAHRPLKKLDYHCQQGLEALIFVDATYGGVILQRMPLLREVT